MTRASIPAFSLLLAAAASAQPAATTNAPPAAPKTISVQEMLVIGPSALKLHSLAMITQGKVKDGVDESFLPGFKACSEDPATPVRSVTARLLGQYFVEGKPSPNPQAVELLFKLAQDEAADVRYSAVYHGITQIQDKPDGILELLIDIAAANREQGLLDRIAESLENDRERVAKMLDRRLEEGDDIAIYEIYESLAGKAPPHAEKYLDMPSSRPRLFIFKGDGKNPDAYKAELERALRDAGIQNPDVAVSGVGENYVLLLKTYITRDNQTVEKKFAGNSGFAITQSMWLTPELEIQIDAMRKAAP